MYLKRFFLQALVIGISAQALAHGFNASASCAENRREQHKHAGKPTIATPEEEFYDVHHLKFNLFMTDTSTYVKGDVTTTAQVTAASMSVYAFELDNTITIDSAKFNGVLATVTSNQDIRTITLGSPLLQGTTFSAQVFYHGYPAPAGAGFFTSITHALTGTGVHMVYTVSDPYVAQDWWPCKQSVLDKIDSVDMWLTVPDGQKAGSNGLLTAVTTPAAGYKRFEWKTHYPIEYYLISLAIAPYFDYSYYVHFDNSPDSMLVQNYFYDSATFMPAYKANFDSTALMINYLGSLFGRYPFDKEKYGHCFTTLQGGMENQTMTTIGVTNTELICHELGHQWFGNHVGYNNWHEVWLSEGFACYTEGLYKTKFWGETAGLNYRTAQYNNVMSQTGGRVYIDDTTSVNTLFDSRLVYKKGAAVVHMLRFLAPADSVFFNTLKAYQQQYAFGNASTADLKNMFEQSYGQGLDTFFNQWVYGEGYIKYQVKWAQYGTQVLLKVTQNTSKPSSVPLFATPLEIKLKSATGDTTIKVYNNQPLSWYSVDWNSTMTGLTVDPNNWILDMTTVLDVVHDQGLMNVAETEKPLLKTMPNPTKDDWNIEEAAPNTQLTLLDMSGKVLWKGNSNTSTVIPGKQLPTGRYSLKINSPGRKTEIVNLVHW